MISVGNLKGIIDSVMSTCRNKILVFGGGGECNKLTKARLIERVLKSARLRLIMRYLMYQKCMMII